MPAVASGSSGRSCSTRSKQSRLTSGSASTPARHSQASACPGSRAVSSDRKARAASKSPTRAAATPRARSSCAETVAVPTFPTTIPAAWLARTAAAGRDAPEARASARTATTVSPAPVTSYTSRAKAGTANGERPRSTSSMPRSPRVTSTAPTSIRSRTDRAAPRQSSSERISTEAARPSSAWLGVTTVAGW